MLFLGRMSLFPIALEGALKLKEISYIHAEGYPAAEMKHGPIALISAECPSVFFAPSGEILNKIVSSMQEIKARKGPIIAIITENVELPAGLADEVIVIPECHEAVLPSGGHMLRVTAPGKVAFQSEVVVQDNETRRIPVTLNALPTPPDTSKWFWIGGGAALAIGAIIGGAVIFTPTQAPAAQGTLGTFPLTFGAK